MKKGFFFDSYQCFKNRSNYRPGKEKELGSKGQIGIEPLTFKKIIKHIHLQKLKICI